MPEVKTQGIKNKHRLTTIYVPKDKDEVWIEGHKLSKTLGFKSLSSYILALMEANLRTADKLGVRLRTERGGAT